MRPVRSRVLGGFSVTAVGYGDLSLARSALRNVDGRTVQRALEDGLSLGITLIDIADEEAAQQLVGETVRALRLRDRVLSAFRIGALPPRPNRPARDAILDCYPIAYVQQRVEAILRGTKLDVVPLVQLALAPAWRASPVWPEFAAGCGRLVREGKVLMWGATALPFDGDVDGAIALASEPWLASLALPFNLCDRAAEPVLAAAKAAADAPPPPPVEAAPPPPVAPSGLITSGSLLDVMSAALSSPLAHLALEELAKAPPAAQPARDEKPVPRAAIFASRVLAGGTLAGTIAPGVKLARADDRRAIDDATLAKIAEGIARLAPLVRMAPPAATATEAARGIVERSRRPDDVEARTVAELAMRFVLDRGATILPRLHRTEYVAEALAAITAPPLSAELQARLDEIFPPA